MSYKQLDILTMIEEGERLREIGMNQAADHAEQVDNGWQQKAFNLLTEWLRKKGTGRQFTMESFRIEMEIEEKISKPPSLRAWGSIAVKASKAGIIKKVGHATVINKNAHRCFCSLWEVK